MDRTSHIGLLYAKAAFDFAVAHQAIQHWQEMLTCAVQVNDHLSLRRMYPNTLKPQLLATTFNTLCAEKLDLHGQNLIRIMAQHGRLRYLPHVLIHFNKLYHAFTASPEVTVISACTLSSPQCEAIAVALQNRLGCPVKLNYHLDKSLLAGCIIQIGDWVIDSTVRGRLNQLAKQLRT